MWAPPRSRTRKATSRFLNLLPGKYRVTAEATGFKRAVRENIELRVNDRLTVDFTLEVGDLAESVVVTAESPLLEAATASSGIVVDERRAAELPIAGGNAFHLSRLSPGIVMSAGRGPGNPTMDLASGQTIVNGTRAGSSEVTLDGVPNTYRMASTYGSPPADLVQEFRIQTVTYDASLGHAAGAVVNVSTRSGTNQLHGSSYHFDSRVRAVPWFSNRWLWDPTTGPVTPEEKREKANPGWLYQRWGDTFSGPVVLPRVYDGRDRTFWSFGCEGMYVRRQGTVEGTMPTMAQRTGDLSELLKLGSRYQVYDPATIAPAAGGRLSRQPLPGNIVPASRINPVARKIIPYWPEPNKTGTDDGRENFFNVQKQDWDYRSMVGRLDQNFSEKHRAFFRLSNSQFDQKNQNIRSPAIGNVVDNTGCRLALDDVYVFRSDLLLNVRYGLSYQNNITGRQSSGFDLLSLGFPQSLLNEIRTKNNPAGITFPETVVDGGAYTTRSITRSLNPRKMGSPDGYEKVQHPAAEAVEAPDHHHVKFLVPGVGHQFIQRGAFFLGAADPVAVDMGDGPAALLGQAAEWFLLYCWIPIVGQHVAVLTAAARGDTQVQDRVNPFRLCVRTQGFRSPCTRRVPRFGGSSDFGVCGASWNQ